MGWLSAAAQIWTVQRAVRDLARYERAVLAPQKTQHAVLFEQLRREQETGFGRDHGFRSIRTLADFRRQVAIHRYEDLQPYIERVQQGETSALFHNQRVRMFALTSGTTQSRKFIPVTDRVLDNYRRVWTAWGLLAYAPRHGLFRHARLTFVSDWDEFRSPSGVPCGSISGFTAQLQSWVVRQGYVLPPESAKLSSEAKNYLAWRVGVLRSIGAWITPNPSTLLNLARYGGEHLDELCRDLHEGTLTDRFEWPAPLRKSIQRWLQPNQARAQQLVSIVRKTGHLRPRDVWPELQLIGCWTGGSMQTYLRSFPEVFGNAGVRDLGLIASEGRMTFPIADNTSSGVLEIVSGFYEFIPVEEIDSLQPTILEAHELQEGRDYYILLTNASGLYRYNIWDVVRCTGWHKATPLLAFLNKGSSISSVTGEKITEYQVVASMNAVLQATGQTIGVYTLAPCWANERPYYGLFIEQQDLRDTALAKRFLTLLDRELREANIEYASKRQSLRLGDVRLLRLPAGRWKEWDESRLARTGGSGEQYKHPCLIPDLEFQKSMDVVETVDV